MLRIPKNFCLFELCLLMLTMEEMETDNFFSDDELRE